MNKDHIDSLIKYLNEQSKYFYEFDRISVLLSKEEIEYLIKILSNRSEPTYEEVIEYCKRRELDLISHSLLTKLLTGR